MKLAGFNFNKISIEKLSDKIEGLKINTNIDISEINPVKAGLFKTKEEFISIKFIYKVDYSPEIAKMALEGNIILAVESKIAKEVLKQWKSKKIPEDFRLSVFNVILKKSSLKALQLEDELNLPLHLPLPTVRKEDQVDSKK